MLPSCFLVPLVRQVLHHSFMRKRNKKQEQEIEKAIDILVRDPDLLDETRNGDNTVIINGKKYRRIRVEP